MSILVDDSNKTACRAAEAGLQQKNCAALVRPAGTGKGCIVWELLDAHPEMRVLWVVSCTARLELRRALAKRLGRTLGGRVRLMSCEQLAVQNALGWVALAEFRPGLLVLDGWREMSAKDWTDCVQPLFRLCPGAKLLALGEPDAPGDSCRAAEEMLADAIVEPLALGGAMAEGLLPMPASYTALLWPLEDAMARLRAEVKNLHLPGCPDPNAEKYQALSLAVEKLPPVEQLLSQWLPDAAGRCLVLCEDDAAAAQTAEQAEKLFGAGTHIYKDAEGFAADEAATLRLLVCANGPAVQAPLAGISGVVLVRRSAEPTAYRQMLARALAACGSVPVAELSAAFEALTCVQQLRKECSAAGAEAFPLEEPLSACRRAYRQLRRALDSDWERYYAAAKQMTAEGKTLDVPRSYSFGGVAVGRWLENQRLVRAGKKKGRLTAAQAARLDKIGMNWQKRLELAWENGCASARRYRDSHSDLLVPVHYKDKDGFALGEWIVYNRQRYLGGNLPSDRVERLEALGMVWDTGSILWEKSYAAAVQYYLENHTLEIPVKYVTPDGMALGVWLGSQRAAYKEGVLTDAQIEKLEALGVDWANRNDRKWQTAYEAAVKYHAAHGNLDVPTEYIDEDGILLGKWVSRQRYAWQNPERSSARVTLERKALLDELGMNWEKTDSWQHRYELAVEYKKEHGSLAVPAQYRTEDGIWLGSWLSRQKQMLREGKKLSAARRAALKELFKGEKGRRLSAPVPPACSVREQNWLDNYQSARLYAEKKGSLLVPAGYVDENGEYQGYDVCFARRLAEDLGVKVNYVSTEAANRIEYLQTGKVDVILANFTVTPERAEEVDFALPYMNVALGVVSPDSNVITSLDSWNADDQMIVISGTTAETYLTQNYPDIPLQKYDSYATAKSAMENGGVAWANDNTEVIAFASQNPGYTVGIPSLGSQDTIAPAVSKGNETLLNAINDEIKALGKENFFHADYEATLVDTYGTDYEDSLVVEGGETSAQ